MKQLIKRWLGIDKHHQTIDDLVSVCFDLKCDFNNRKFFYCDGCGSVFVDERSLTKVPELVFNSAVVKHYCKNCKPKGK